MGSKPIGISASRGAAILGINRYRSALEVWLEMQEQDEPGWCTAHGYQLPDSAEVDPWAPDPEGKYASMRWGLSFESAICEHLNISDCENFYNYTIDGGLQVTCHIDGHNDRGGTVENKTTHIQAWRAGWGEPGTGDVPLEYAVQAQHQMAVTGAVEIIFNVVIFPWPPAEAGHAGFKLVNDGTILPPDDEGPSYIDLKRFVYMLDKIGMIHQYIVKRDDEFIKKMIDQYSVFYKCLKNETPPPAVSSDLKWCVSAFAGEIAANDQLVDLRAEWSDLAAEKKRISDREKEIKDQFASYISKNASSEWSEKLKKIELRHPTRINETIAGFTEKGGLRIRKIRD